MAVLALLLNNQANAVTDHENGIAGNAPCVDNYIGVWESATVGYDPHAVHGLEANDGGTVITGMSLTSETGKTKQGFVVKTFGTCANNFTYYDITSTGTDCNNNWEWVTIVGYESLWVAESNDNSFLIAVGLKESGGQSVMNIAKLNASDGSIVWEMAYGTSSGAETVAFTSDGGFVVGGYIDSTQPLSDINFKSGGQVAEATPFIGKISAADAAASSAPSGFEWTYTNSDSAYMGSAKALRIDSSDNVFSIAGTNSAAIKLSSSGSETWATGTLDSGAQMNDIELTSDGMVLVGHKYSKSYNGCAWGSWGSGCGIIIGHMMKLDANGAVQWSKDYGNYPGGKNQYSGLKAGDEILVYNECWGVSSRYEGSSSTQVGFNLACGTGVEGCNLLHLDPWTFLKCYYDPRRTWRALTIATDLNGDRVWSRMDSFQTSESGTVASSAGEYVFPSTNGEIKIVTDETMGMGILTIQDYDGNLCTSQGSYTYDFAKKLAYSTLAVTFALFGSTF